MKKTKLVIVGTLSLLLLAGCTAPKKASKPVENEIAGELTIVTNRTDGDDIFEKIEKGFIEKYPEVTEIKWEAIADYDDTIMTRLNSNDYGDVLFVPFSLAGLPSEYSNYFESLGKVTELEKDYLDVTEADFDNEVYGLPVALNSLGIIYNDAVLTEAGVKEVPTTQAEFLAAAKAIKAKTKSVPFYTNYQRVAIWAGALTSFGGEQFKSETLAKGNAFAEGQPIRQIMDLFYELASQGLIEADPVTLESQTAQQQLADGKIGMLMSGSQDVAPIQELAKENETVKIMNFPVEREGKTSLPLGAPAVLGISNKSENKATARAFLDYFISVESGYAKNLNGMTPVKADLNAAENKLMTENNVILTVATESAEDEAKYSKIAEEAGVARLTDVLQQVINIGLYPDKNETYADYIKGLEKNWSQAVKDNE